MSDLILAIDTTHEFGSIALLEGATPIEEAILHAPDGFGHVLFDRIFRNLSPSLSDINNHFAKGFRS